MPNLNQVNLIGHVTRPVDLRHTPKGTAVAEIGVAINREWKTESGEQKSEVVFVEVTAWARLAEVCAEFLTKGSPVFFSGRLDQESWIDKQSQQKRTKLRVIAEQMQLLGSKSAPAASQEEPEL
jgi:single-strand DNA-binding protein